MIFAGLLGRSGHRPLAALAEPDAGTCRRSRNAADAQQLQQCFASREPSVDRRFLF